jgi:xylulokinase
VAEAVIGIDVGTTGVKALAVSPEGTVVARFEEPYPLLVPRPGWSEQDPEHWWRATERALAGFGEFDVRGIGLSGQMHGLVVLDRDSRVLRPAILWNDQRTAVECREIEERLGLDRLIRLTGNRALPGFTAPKLLWVRRREPDVFERIAQVLLPKDFVRLRLTGQRATDAADASGTLLLDVQRRAWSSEVIRALDLDPALLPPVLESSDVSGRTAAGIPVAAGAGDQAAAALGIGVAGPGALAVSLGTSGVVFAALPSYAPEPQARVHVFCHAVPATWHAMGVMLSAGGSLRWLRDVVAPGATYDELVAEAAGWEPGCEGLRFLPYLAGERTPHADPDARGAFAGLSLHHDRGALVRAVLEGVAFGLRDCLGLLRELGVPAEEARASGGGARSELWLRIVASVLHIRVQRVAVDEGAAYGAAMLGAVAAGVFGDVRDVAAAWVRVRDEVDPDPHWIDRYDGGYAAFRALYPALHEVFDVREKVS